MPARSSPGAARIALCLALAAHVADEALTDFLSVYNPAVRARRERVPWLPLPVFTFESRLPGGPLSYVFAFIMTVNGLGHIAGSIYLGPLMPGVFSAPLLLAASAWLLATTRGAGPRPA